MRQPLNFLAASIVFFGICVMVAWLQPAQVSAHAVDIQPTQTMEWVRPTSWPVATRTPAVPTPKPTPDTPSVVGWAGKVQCYNCAPFDQKVRVSVYDPTVYNPEYPQLNCFDYHDGYCYSPTASGIPWKSVWGIAAACPVEWPYGTWVDLGEIGRYICLDRGGAIKCLDGVCNVDILGPGGAWWVGSTVDAVLWVPLNPKK